MPEANKFYYGIYFYSENTGMILERMFLGHNNYWVLISRLDGN